MVDKIAEIYRKSPMNIVTYDFIDIEEGVGYVTLYGYNQSTSGATVYRLGRERVYSQDIEISGASAAGWGNIKDVDFDISFNQPKVINGAIKFNIPYHQAGGGSPSSYIFANVFKYDGSTETALGSVCSKNFQAGTTPSVINMEVDINSIKFIPSDTLRINLVLQAQSNPASTHAIYHDPQARNGWNATVGTNIGTTTFSVQVPFVLDTT